MPPSRRAFPLVLILLIVASPLAQAAFAEVRGDIPLPPCTQQACGGNERNGLVGAAVGYVGGYSYILGGRYRDGSTFSHDILKYDPATGRVDPAGTLPPVTNAPDPGRFESAGAVLGGRIYIFGGAVQIPAVLRPGQNPEPVPTSVKDIVEYDPVSQTATKLKDTQLPYSVWGAQAVAYGDSIFIFGGFSFSIPTAEYGRHDTVLQFQVHHTVLAGQDTLSYTLQTLQTQLPFPVQQGAAAALGNRIYFMGGFGDHTNDTDANKCPVNHYYDSASQQWRDAQTTACNADAIIAFNPDSGKVLGVTARLPYHPQWAAAATVKNKIYVMGGVLANGVSSTSIVEFDPSNLQSPTRLLVPTLPTGLYAPGVSTDGSTITLFGGRHDEISSATSNITFVDPRASLPWAPRSPVATKAATSVRITWDPPAYNGDSPITAYRVYRSTVAELEKMLTETTALAFNDDAVSPNVQYSYRITAVNAIGESKTSARAALTSETVPPAKVSAFELFSGNAEVLLRWSAPIDNGGANLTGYRLYRNESPEPFKVLPPSEIEYRDTGLANGATYRYSVAAVNVKGQGALSVVLSATPIAVPPAPFLVTAAPDTTGVKLTWESPATSVRGFVVLRGDDPAKLVTLTTLGGDARTFADANAKRGNTYYYAIAASNDVGTSPPSNVASVSLVSKPGAPDTLIAAPGDGFITLTWKPPADTGEAPPSALSYFVSRDGRIIATDIKGATFTDRGVLANRTYAYTVTTFNGLEGDPSAPASAAARPVINKPPIATVAVLSSIVLAGDPVEIDASQSTDPDGTISSFTYNFGDGSPPIETTMTNVTHSYAKNGTYTITLTAVDNRGLGSEPSKASLQVGLVLPSDKPKDDTLTPPTASPPGSKPGKLLPGPEVALVLALVLVAALGTRRHSRR